MPANCSPVPMISAETMFYFSASIRVGRKLASHRNNVFAVQSLFESRLKAHRCANVRQNPDDHGIVMAFATGDPLVTSSPASSRSASSSSLSPDPLPYLERGSRAYWHAAIALLFAGYATFSLLYCVQPLLPEFTKTFGVSPAESALSVSVTTASLAVAIFHRRLCFRGLEPASVDDVIADGFVRC